MLFRRLFMRKGLVGLLVIILCVFTFSVAVADDTRTSGLYTYTIKGNGTITITAFDWKNNDGDIYVPSTMDGYTVTGIGEEAFACEEYNAARGPEGPFVNLRLPDTIITIGDRAFLYAPILNINIPQSLQSIGSGAFGGCFVKQFMLDSTHDLYAVVDGALYNKKNKELIAYPIGDRTRQIKIPEGIQKIGDYAFFNFYVFETASSLSTNFESISDIIPNTVTTIGQYAFANATWHLPYSGKRMSFNINAETVEPYAFYKADVWDATGLTINSKFIGDHAFEGIGGGTSRVEISFGNNIESIGDYAFSESSAIIQYPTNSQLSKVGVYAFYKTVTKSVTEYEIPSGLTTIEEASFAVAFNNLVWHNVTSIIIPEGVTEIEANAFRGNSYIEKISLPSTLQSIGDNAFDNCTDLKEIQVPAGVSKIGTSAFDKTSVMLIVERDSATALWAQENGYNYKYSDDSGNSLDWLNN